MALGEAERCWHIKEKVTAGKVVADQARGEFEQGGHRETELKCAASGYLIALCSAIQNVLPMRKYDRAQHDCRPGSLSGIKNANRH